MKVSKKEHRALVQWLVKKYSKYGMDEKRAQEHVDFYYQKNYSLEQQ